MTDPKDKSNDESLENSGGSSEAELSPEEQAALERWQAMIGESADVDAETETEMDSLAQEETPDLVLGEAPQKIAKASKTAKAKAKEKSSKKRSKDSDRSEGEDEDDLPREEVALADVESQSSIEDSSHLADTADLLGSAEHKDAEELALSIVPTSAPHESRDEEERKELVLSSEINEDRQGLMLWDEAINLEAQVEAIIFASPKPISVSEIAEILANDDGVEPEHFLIDNHVQQLQRLYKERNGGFRLEYEKGAGFQFRTIPAAAPIMERMFSSKQRPLSRAAHETLAIIAYRQPCTRADIEFIRGVDAGSIIKNLLERDLVTCVGRKEDSGRPMLFGTTAEFLRVFRIQTLNDLPPLSAFQPRSEEMIQAFQKIENGDGAVDVEGFIGDEDRDPILITQNQLANFAASDNQIEVREDELGIAPAPAQIRRAGGSYDDEGYSRDDGFEDTEVAFGTRDSIAPGGGEDASRGADHDQRPSGERARDED